MPRILVSELPKCLDLRLQKGVLGKASPRMWACYNQTHQMHNLYWCQKFEHRCIVNHLLVCTGLGEGGVALSGSAISEAFTINSSFASHLQIGHKGFLEESHWSMHSMWNLCWHGSTLSFSPSLQTDTETLFEWKYSLHTQSKVEWEKMRKLWPPNSFDVSSWVICFTEGGQATSQHLATNLNFLLHPSKVTLTNWVS